MTYHKNTIFIFIFIFEYYSCSNTKNILDTTSLRQTNLVLSVQKTNNNKTYSIDDINFAFTKSICNTDNCSPLNGRCSPNRDICKCLDGFVNIDLQPENKKERYCEYEQSTQLIAFLLETFFPFGVGHLYCGRTINGLFKLIFNICVPCILFSIFGVCISARSNNIYNKFN